MKRKASKALREHRRTVRRREAAEAARLRRAIHIEQERRTNLALARDGLVDCCLCGRRFWPWSEMETVAAIPVHAHCKAAWIAGRTESAHPETSTRSRDEALRSPAGPTP